MTLAISTITNSIAALTVEGVTILDIDQIPADATTLRQAVIIPRPDGFVTNFNVTRQSTGSNGTAKLDVRYTLNYRLLYSVVGAGRVFGDYAGMVAAAFAFMDEVLDNDAITGLVDLTPREISTFGPVPDPGGTLFHGCDIGLDILEFEDS